MSNEHDITKAMLETIRLNEIAYKKNLNEQQEDIIDLEGEELSGEEGKFSEMITPRVTFGPFKIYPDAGNAVFSGKLDNGIEWQFSKLDGAYVDMSNIELTDEIVELTKKINAYYIEWAKIWGDKLRLEYSGNKNGEI